MTPAAPTRPALRGLCAVTLIESLDADALLDTSERCANGGASVLELRLDGLPLNALEDLTPDALAELIEASVVPCIATCRRIEDGGRWPGDEALRERVLRMALEAGASWIDVELGACNALAHVEREHVLRSWHGFQSCDENALLDQLNALVASAATQLKLVFTADSYHSNALAKRVLARVPSKVELTCFCMGDAGLASRINALAWGSALTYVAAPGTQAVAPGMLSLDEYARLYANQSAADTKHYAVIGGAVRHSLSPWIHRACFDARNENASYQPIVSASLEEVLSDDTLGLQGASITWPCKAQAATLASNSQSMASANTLSRDGEGWSAANTDGIGFLADLLAFVSRRELARARVLVLGAGGSARAVVAALRDHAGEICIAGRTLAKVKALAMEQGVSAHPNPASDEFGFDLIINCTPVGMIGGEAEDAAPIALADLTLNPDAKLYDLIYNPSETPLMREARALGMPARNGLGMLLWQALAQQLIWHKQALSKLGEVEHFPLLLQAASEQLIANPSFRPPLRIALIGYRCAGKTSVGKRLAAKLGLPFFDLDAVIEAQTRCSIGDLLSESEPNFRNLESQALENLIATQGPCVLATGGGCIESLRTRQLLRSHFTLIYLEASDMKLVERQREHRTEQVRLDPALSLEEETKLRLARRLPHYQRLADIITTSDSDDLDAIANTLAERLIGPSTQHASLNAIAEILHDL